MVSDCPPVMICGFNRPECLSLVFSAVRSAKPAQLFLVLDAPREGRQNDVNGVEACKKIFEEVDWPCEVHRNYAEQNMGCKMRMSSGITWTFEHVDRAIILEDDCLPCTDFFRFCAEMLETYKDDTRIGSIAGYRLPSDNIHHETSYHFSRFTQIWGWATWRRAWSAYNNTELAWLHATDRSFLCDVFQRPRLIKNVSRWFDDACAGRNNSWATIWWLTSVMQNFLTIHPSVNLVKNVGYIGTHTEQKSDLHDTKYGILEWPLVAPEFVAPGLYEDRLMRMIWTPSTLFQRAVNFLKRKVRV